MKRISIEIPEEQHRRLRLMAADRQANMRELVRQWIDDAWQSTDWQTRPAEMALGDKHHAGR